MQKVQINIYKFVSLKFNHCIFSMAWRLPEKMLIKRINIHREWSLQHKTVQILFQSVSS